MIQASMNKIRYEYFENDEYVIKKTLIKINFKIKIINLYRLN